MKPLHPRCCRIVLTGGPGGGKTTAADLFRQEIGERVVLVPEAATILFQGGFPRSAEPHARRFAQTAIYHVQRHLEDVQASLYPSRALLCDRGTIDGAAYWPGEAQSAAVGGASLEGGSPIRNETREEAAGLATRAGSHKGRVRKGRG